MEPTNVHSFHETTHLPLQQDVHRRIFTLSSHLAKLSNSGIPTDSTGQLAGVDDDVEGPGIKIITLAGTNKGATMQVEDLEELRKLIGDEAEAEGEAGELGSYTNSNYQAVNNSVMMGGSYGARDPGVHMEILMGEDGTTGVTERHRGKGDFKTRIKWTGGEPGKRDERL